MAKLIVPTRNRPASLGKMLNYLCRFFPSTEVIVADGSAEEYRRFNEEAVQTVSKTLEVEYRQYDAMFPYFDRILDVLTGLKDDVAIVGADDDYPQLDVLENAEKLLEKHSDIVSAMGASVRLRLLGSGELFAGLAHAHPLLDEKEASRIANYFRWPFATTYAVTRREHLIERCKRAKGTLVSGSIDRMLAIHDAMSGKVAVVPGFSFFRTQNFNHSYLRPQDPLGFLAEGEKFIQFRDQIQEDFVERVGLSREKAEALSRKFVGEIIVGRVRPARRRKTREWQSLVQEPVVFRQIGDFYDLFREGSATKSKLEQRVAHIVAGLKEVSNSKDNQGEAMTYGSQESLTGEISNKPDQTSGTLRSGESTQLRKKRKKGGAFEPYFVNLVMRHPWLRRGFRPYLAKSKSLELRYEISSDTLVRKVRG